MRLFGRAIGRQAGGSGIPPELQPYYTTQPSAPVQSLGGLVALIVVLVFVIAALGGWLWLHEQSVSRHENPPIAQAPSQHAAPVIPAPEKKAVAPPPQNQADVPQTSSPQATAPAPTAIPNTGPGTTALWLAATVGVIGAAASYLRSLRSSLFET